MDRDKFHRAARDGHLDLLKETTRRDCNQPDEDGLTPTLSAAYSGRLHALRLLVGRGGDPDKCDLLGNTALHWAAANNHYDCVTFLVNFGCNLWSLNNDFHTAKDFAALRGHKLILDYIDNVMAKESSLNMKTVQKQKEKAISDTEKRIKTFEKLQQKANKKAEKEEKQRKKLFDPLKVITFDTSLNKCDENRGTINSISLATLKRTINTNSNVPLKFSDLVNNTNNSNTSYINTLQRSTHLNSLLANMKGTLNSSTSSKLIRSGLGAVSRKVQHKKYQAFNNVTSNSTNSNITNEVTTNKTNHLTVLTSSIQDSDVLYVRKSSNCTNEKILNNINKTLKYKPNLDKNNNRGDQNEQNIKKSKPLFTELFFRNHQQKDILLPCLNKNNKNNKLLPNSQTSTSTTSNNNHKNINNNNNNNGNLSKVINESDLAIQSNKINLEEQNNGKQLKLEEENLNLKQNIQPVKQGSIFERPGFGSVAFRHNLFSQVLQLSNQLNLDTDCKRKHFTNTNHKLMNSTQQLVLMNAFDDSIGNSAESSISSTNSTISSNIIETELTDDLNVKINTKPNKNRKPLKNMNACAKNELHSRNKDEYFSENTTNSVTMKLTKKDELDKINLENGSSNLTSKSNGLIENLTNSNVKEEQLTDNCDESWADVSTEIAIESVSTICAKPFSQNNKNVCKLFIDGNCDISKNSLNLFLTNTHLEQYLELFEKEKIDFDALMLLNEHDLITIGLPLGPRKKLLNAISQRNCTLNKCVCSLNDTCL